MPMRCPRCSSENLISLDRHYFWTWMAVKIFRRKPPKPERKKQLLRCLDCGKIFSMYDV
ncbi:hypothetical protein [Mailhella massiliensis]|uniref:hypothetical protein n=1 Tax=Mailhella massiliensis TaxID=1903261 RepID=UPI0012B64281|nr:hypothetical protein [Mailhella massiliensis]